MTRDQATATARLLEAQARRLGDQLQREEPPLGNDVVHQLLDISRLVDELKGAFHLPPGAR